MVAFSPIMVYYSKELKQYSGDACFAVLVVYLAERLRASEGRRGWLALALAGLVGLGFSHAPDLLPAGGGAHALAQPARGRRGTTNDPGRPVDSGLRGLLLPVHPP